MVFSQPLGVLSISKSGTLEQRQLTLPVATTSFAGQWSLSHRPVGELTNTGVGAMGFSRRGRPLYFVASISRSYSTDEPWC